VKINYRSGATQLPVTYLSHRLVDLIIIIIIIKSWFSRTRIRFIDHPNNNIKIQLMLVQKDEKSSQVLYVRVSNINDYNIPFKTTSKACR